MAAAVVEPENLLKFFCHKCNVEFEDGNQIETCPYCASGFIEQLAIGASIDDDDSFSDSQDEDEYELRSYDFARSVMGSNMANFLPPPPAHELGEFMPDGILQPTGSRAPRPGRNQDTLMEQLVWMIGGRGDGGGGVTVGAPFVLVGAPGDYVFGGDGLDSVVTQLLGQLENTGPPPLTVEQISAIPIIEVEASQIEGNVCCTVCWDPFTLGEAVSQLKCSHIFHQPCISPWLKNHATCPICRRSQLPYAAIPAPRLSVPASGEPSSSTSTSLHCSPRGERDRLLATSTQ